MNTPKNKNVVENQFTMAAGQPIINPNSQVQTHKKIRKYIILATLLAVILIGLIIYFYFIKNKSTKWVGKLNPLSSLSDTSNSNHTAQDSNNIPISSEDLKKIQVSSKVVPKKPDVNWKDTALPSKKAIFKIPLNVIVDENIYNEADPNQKDFRAYSYGNQGSVLPLILADRRDKNAAGANRSAAIQFGKDESGFIQNLRTQKINFVEENIIIDNKLAKLIFVGSNADDMSFYCSVIQTVNNEFYTYTLSSRDDKTQKDDLFIFEKFLGSVKYQ